MMLSVAHLCQLFVPGMRDRGFGRVVNVSSFAAGVVPPREAIYAASKAALIALSDAAREEQRENGIRVGVLLPGS